MVDDGSTDGSLEILRRWRDSGRFAELRMIEREHSGVVEALNAGLAAATGELIVQLDGDASVETPGWLDKMVAFFALRRARGRGDREDRVRLGRDPHLRRRHDRSRRASTTAAP